MALNASTRYVQDFDELWSTVAARYAYFDNTKTDWNCVRDRYRPMALNASGADELKDVLSSALNELYDRHTVIRDQRAGTQRDPYYDMLVEVDGNAARVVTLRDGWAAQAAGLMVGDRILAINQRDLTELMAELIPKCLSHDDPAAEAYALNRAVSGLRGQARTLTVQSVGSAPREVELLPPPDDDESDFEARLLEDGIGYIAIRSFADSKTVADFDMALDRFRSVSGLVIDVRDNGGGDTAVAGPIMGRFITARAPYALMKRREGAGLSEAWTEYVEPRGPFTFDAPVVVLTNHWSASMAEGFPMGMRSLGRATIVGTRMMQLGAAVFDLRLDRTGIDAQYSGEPVYEITGSPREDLKPDVMAGVKDDILQLGISQLRRKIHERTEK